MKPERESGPVASIQIDLDGVWAIRRCYGDRSLSPEDADAVYSEGLPRWLDLLDELELRASFFAVGRDAQADWKAELLRQTVQRGHEIGNHSMTHPLDLASLPQDALESEVCSAQRALNAATGFHPRGFKAPGYSISDALIRLLDERGFVYDASLFSTPWGGAMRGLTRWLSHGKGENSGTQYGGNWSGGRFLTPRVVGAGRGLLEAPVCVTPFLRLPFHGGIALALGEGYFRRCLDACRRAELPLNYTLHGVDLTGLGAKELTGGRGGWFFRHDAENRRRRVKDILRLIQERYKILPVLDATQLWKSAFLKENSASDR
ncbi:polysaccharide deacetylase family protein [Candidatus Sumerlaeota bacterium]|nr:polysaccharide deacetylase family protein [Candidatus Sumerlaeota bacterium]